MTEGWRPDRRQLLLGGVMLSGAGAAAVAHPGRRLPAIDQAAFDRAIPNAIGVYRATTAADAVLPPADEVTSRIYDRYLARVYSAPDLPAIELVIAFGATQDYALQLHRPEVCYPASGWTIGPLTSQRLQIDGGGAIPAVALEARRPGRHDQIVYWTRVGEAFPTDRWSERLEILRGTLQRRPPDGVIVRLSMSMQDASNPLTTLAQFNREFIAASAHVIRPLLIGPMA